jgi:hypothetical protein
MLRSGPLRNLRHATLAPLARGTAGWGEPNPEPVGVIMPGDKAERSRGFETGTNMAVSGAAVRFTDAAGGAMAAHTRGALVEQQQ